MFEFVETPFSPDEVLRILNSSESHILGYNGMVPISRNVICEFRCDDKFNFSNFYDILAFGLADISFSDLATDSPMEDLVFEFVDDLSYMIEFVDDQLKYCVDERGPEVVSSSDLGPFAYDIVCDPMSPKLRQLSKYGEHIQSRANQIWDVDLRSDIYMSVTATLFHRALHVVYADTLERNEPNKVHIVSPNLAVAHGRLLTYRSSIAAE